MGSLPKLNIAQKLPLALVLSALLVSAGVGIASYLIGSRVITDLAQARIKTAAVHSATELTAYFGDMEGRLLDMAGTESVQNAVRDMALSWDQFGAEDPIATVRSVYIDQNPGTGWARADLEKPTGAKRSFFDYTHIKVHPELRKQMQMAGFTDLYIVDLKGNLVYSVGKQDDFATNLADGGNGAATPLAAAYRSAVAMTERGRTVFSDFAAYAPWGGAPASFMAMPIFNARDKIMGVLAASVSTDALNTMLAATDDLGATDETLLVGSDFLLRSDSPFSTGRDELTTSLRNSLVETALGGTPATGVTADYRGMPMIMEAVPAQFGGTKWALVTAIGQDEALAPVADLRNMMLVVGGVLLALAALGGWLFARTISRPLSRLTQTMDRVAAGDYAVAVPGSSRADEIGAMARAVEVFRANGLRIAEMTEAEAAQIIRTQGERAAMMEALQRSFGLVVDAAVAGDFSRRVEAEFADAELNALARSVNNLVATVEQGLLDTGGVLAALADTDLTQHMQGDYQGAFARLQADTNAVTEKLCAIVGDLRDTSGTLKVATGEILSGANDLSERTTKQAATIEETSATMEQLASTVLHNAERAREASVVAADVTRTADEGGQVMFRATDAMERITQSSGKISNIIGMIDDIAFQTNLLALNASVEAARAGDAGKGFAVVAVEVRRLAQSAAQASSEVKVLIEQSAGEVRDGSRLVADAAAKLQTMLEAARSSNALMGGIARESKDQAAAIEEVNTAVRTMDEMTQHNAALVEEMNAAIEQTEAQASALDRIVAIFHIEAPAAASRSAPIAVVPAPAPVRPLRVQTAARAYLARGNAAIDADWNEF